MNNIRNSIFILLSIYTTPGLTETLAPISVTASRSPVSIDQSGSSISVIDKQEIQKRQLPFTADLLRDVPGVAISQNGGTGTLTQLRLRGSESNHTLVLIDGIEANDIASGSEFNFANLVTCGLHKVEILRGPQSAVWGSDALAGVVSIQTIKGSGPAHFESTTSAGFLDTRQNCSGVSGGNDIYNYSLYGSYFENNGQNISQQGSEDDNFRNSTFNARVGAQLNDKFSVNFSGRHVNSNIETDPFDPPIDADRETDSIQNYFKVNTNLNTIEDQWRHEANISVTDTENKFSTNSSQSSSSAGEKIKFDYLTSFKVDTNKINHTLTLVYERERERFKQSFESFPSANQQQKMHNTGYVGEYRADIDDKLFLSASLRKDDNDKFENAYSHRISAAYSPNSGSTYHIAYGTSVKNPSFTEVFGFFPGSFIGNPDLDPEKSKGWEIGTSHVLEYETQIKLIYFSEKLKNEISNGTDSTSGLQTSINLDGKSRRKGVEFSINSKPLENFSIKSSLSYIDSKQPNNTGKSTEIRVPKKSASLLVNYNFMSNRANLNASVSYTGDQFDNDFSDFSNIKRVNLEDYTLVNLAGSYQVNNWLSINGRIENLFGKNYQDVFGYETENMSAHIGLKLENF